MRLVSLVGSRHHDHDRDPNGGSGGATTTTTRQLRSQLGRQRAAGWFAMRTSPCRPTTSAGSMRTHTRQRWQLRANNSACIVDMQQAQLGRAKARDENCAVWGGGLTCSKDSRTQRTEADGRNRSNPNTRTQGKQRRRRRRESGRGGKDVCEKKGGWGKRAESADDVLPSESAKFTALGSDAQRRSWGRESRGWRHDLLDRADTSFGDRYKDGGPHGCNALYQAADWLRRHCTPRQGRN